jgi:nicotinamidase-related amidase
MPITTLDAKTALILIDLQKGILALPITQPGDTVVKLAAGLAEAFRKHALPVVLVNVAGGAPGRNEQSGGHTDYPADWADLVPALNQQPSDHTVTKKTWGAFVNTDLEAYLKRQGVTQVVIAGVATSIGVESTARQAFELGFNVTLAIDAMADLNPDTHVNSITRIFPRLGETGTCSDIIAMLEKTHGKQT